MTGRDVTRSRRSLDSTGRCRGWLVIGLLMIAGGDALDARPVKNGFDLVDALVPARQIRRGGPPRDGIPAIMNPQFRRLSAMEAAGEPTPPAAARVLGIVRHGVAKAYPVRILVWHEIVNDRTLNDRLLVTYCPLCGSGMAFEAGADVFGVSGLLYNSDMLLYDRRTDSLWSQIGRRALTGPRRGERLHSVPLVHTSLGEWRRRYPQTFVLTEDTGYAHVRYGSDAGPYRGYEKTRQLLFPVTNKDRRLPAKAWVLGVVVDGVARAYPFDRLPVAASIPDRIGEVDIVVHRERDGAFARTSGGELLDAVRMYWFAWAAFHPDTQVFAGVPEDAAPAR